MLQQAAAGCKRMSNELELARYFQRNNKIFQVVFFWDLLQYFLREDKP